MAHVKLSSKTRQWIHIKRIGEEDFKFLRKNFGFHPLDYGDIRSETPISKLDTYEDYIFCVFHIPIMEKERHQIHGADLHVFLANNLFVTVTNSPIRSVEAYVKKMQKDSNLKKETLGKGPAFAMHALLDYSFQTVLPIVSSFSKDAARLEIELQEHHARKTTVNLGRVRRNVLYTRHIIDPQRHMLQTLTGLKRSFLTRELKPYLDDLSDTLDTIWLTCDNLKLIIDGLFDVNEALLSHRTNNVITLLTIISASLMAPALIAGFYGMNVPWLPHFEDPIFVGLLYLAAFFVFILAVILVVRRKME